MWALAANPKNKLNNKIFEAIIALLFIEMYCLKNKLCNGQRTVHVVIASHCYIKPDILYIVECFKIMCQCYINLQKQKN